MPKLSSVLATAFVIAATAGGVTLASISAASAEVFYCESTRTPNGFGKYCNFLLFDRNFSRHTEIIVPRDGKRNFAVKGRYDVFCVLVQDTAKSPDNLKYRTQQCKKSDTGRNYQNPIKALNMRRGRDGFSTDNLSILAPTGARY